MINRSRGVTAIVAVVDAVVVLGSGGVWRRVNAIVLVLRELQKIAARATTRTGMGFSPIAASAEDSAIQGRGAVAAAATATAVGTPETGAVPPRRCVLRRNVRHCVAIGVRVTQTREPPRERVHAGHGAVPPVMRGASREVPLLGGLPRISLRAVRLGEAEGILQVSFTTIMSAVAAVVHCSSSRLQG